MIVNRWGKGDKDGKDCNTGKDCMEGMGGMDGKTDKTGKDCKGNKEGKEGKEGSLEIIIAPDVPDRKKFTVQHSKIDVFGTCPKFMSHDQIRSEINRAVDDWGSAPSICPECGKDVTQADDTEIRANTTEVREYHTECWRRLRRGHIA